MRFRKSMMIAAERWHRGGQTGMYSHLPSLKSAETEGIKIVIRAVTHNCPQKAPNQEQKGEWQWDSKTDARGKHSNNSIWMLWLLTALKKWAFTRICG